MTSTPVLALQNFSEPFEVECNASKICTGVVLLQNGEPIAFYSQALALQHRKLQAYEKELLGLAKAIRHWRTYLWGVIAGTHRPLQPQIYVGATYHNSPSATMDQQAVGVGLQGGI